jgi:hypothetical protein
MKSAALRRLISSPGRNYTGYAIPDMLAERVGVAQQMGELGFREADTRECQFRITGLTRCIIKDPAVSGRVRP